MKDIIWEIVKAVVDNPNDVDVNEIDGGRTKIIELRVAKDDVGKVIGKKGRTISAIRTLLASASGKEKVRYVLELLE
ncbi:MAG: KH domain-containing protein [bacterium]